MKAGFTLRIDPIAGKAGENGLPEDVQPLAKPVQEQPLARPARREQEEAGQVETEQQKPARLEGEQGLIDEVRDKGPLERSKTNSRAGKEDSEGLRT